MRTDMKTVRRTVIHKMAPYRQQRGMTLIEIMVALVISLFLLGGLIKIVDGNKQTYRVQDAMARVQENGRFSLFFLTKDVRMAGFMGCSSPGGGLSVTNNVAPSGTGNNTYTTDLDDAIGSYNGTDAVQGFSYTTGSLPSELTAIGLTTGGGFGTVVENTDVLYIRRAVSCSGANVTGMTANGGTAQLNIADNSECQIQQADIVMVSNCQTADIFGVSNNPQNGVGVEANIAHGANWNDSPLFDNTYGPDSFVYRMRADVFYIGEGSSGEPSLFKRELVLGGMTNKELVEGIEDMTILYGEDLNSDGIADTYVTAGSVTNMENIISVRITTTARTLEDNIATEDTASGDRKIRRDFTTTIGIRNRMS